MPGFNVTDINGEEYLNVDIEFAKLNLLNRVKSLSVFGFVGGEMDGSDYDEDEFDRKSGIFYGELASFLSKTTRRIGTIKIEKIPDGVGEVLEYQTFLSTIFTIAESIEGIDCFFDEESLAMQGLWNKNGPKKFIASFVVSDNSVELAMLSLAIAASRSLEHLEIRSISCEGDPEGNLIATAMRSNKSLGCFCIDIWNDFSNPTKMLQAALEHPKLHTLKMKLGGSMNEMVRQSSWEVLRDGVSRLDCNLTELSLDHLSFPDEAFVAHGDSQVQASGPQNDSITSLALVNTKQTLAAVMGVVRLFKSLVHLDISGGNYCGDHDDLSALDDLLLSQTASLQSLCMSHCQIGLKPMMGFVRKLDRMKQLKLLIVANNPFTQSESCMTALKEALWKNTCLEFVSLGGNIPQAIVEKLNLPFDNGMAIAAELLSSSEMFPLHLNQAGRATLQINSHNMESGQLPWIIERAGKIEYYCRGKEASYDVTFWLLRYIMTAQLSAC